jgi:MtN3 and saliva related transmembrane protein
MFSNIDGVTILGLAAGAFTTVAFVPQVIRTWRLKSASDLSLAMISLNATGIFLWMIYGLYVRSLPIIVANLVTFILICLVLILAVKHRRATG